MNQMWWPVFGKEVVKVVGRRRQARIGPVLLEFCPEFVGLLPPVPPEAIDVGVMCVEHRVHGGRRNLRHVTTQLRVNRRMRTVGGHSRIIRGTHEIIETITLEPGSKQALTQWRYCALPPLTDASCFGKRE